MFRTTLNIFLKSREKILIKRRKIQLKNRPLSQKRLQEEREHVNVAFETKKLNILKEMDRVKNPNLHINEIVEDLFYPELRFNNEEEVDQRVRQVTSEGIKPQDQWEDLVQNDSITSSLKRNALPLQLLAVHEEMGDSFSADHYQNLLNKMNYFVYNIDRVRQYRMANWQKMVARMKSRDTKSKDARCPYLFLQKEEITRHEHWLNMIEKMRAKIEQEKDISNVNQYIYSLFDIRKTFYFVPAELYLAILNKNAAARSQELTDEHVSNLLALLKIREKVKFNPNVVIASPDVNLPKEHNHAYLARKLAAKVIDNPERFSVQDLINIFKIIKNRKRKMDILDQEHYPKIEAIVQPILSDLSYNIVQTLISVYCVFNKNVKREFVEVLIFDLYRKADQCKNYFFLYELIVKIKSRKLEFKMWAPKGVPYEKIKFQAYDLLIRLSQVLVTMTGDMKSYELVELLNTIYNNDVRDKEIIEILSTAIVKKGSELDLEMLATSLFQLTVLGHSSKVLAKYVFSQFDQKYQGEMKKYKEQGMFLLPSEEKVQPMNMNFKQIHLQECLLMMLWSLIKQTQGNIDKEVGLIKVMELIPVKIESGDPLAMELALNINASLKEFSLFPKITNPNFKAEEFPLGRFKQFYNRDYSRDKIDRIMVEQARESGLFVGNYNFKADMFIPERWSGLKVYSKKAYIDFCLSRKDKVEQSKGNCFFSPEVNLSKQFLEKRKEVFEDQKQKNEDPEKETEKQSKKKSKKLYDMLL